MIQTPSPPSSPSSSTLAKPQKKWNWAWQQKQSCETKQQDGGKNRETPERVDAESAKT